VSARPVAISEELAEFLESGVSILVGTRNAELRPSSHRAFGARVDRATSRVTVLLPIATAARTRANLESNREIAVAFSRVIDHRSVQLKGPCTEIRDSDAADRAVQERYRAQYFGTLALIGLPEALLQRATWWPSLAVTFQVREAYEQTPGPLAGSRLVVE
jgi:hypothetical protein